MPNVEPEWEKNAEAHEMCKKLIGMYPEKLGHIDPEIVACVQIANKERPDSAKWFAKISGIEPPVSLFCSKQYLIWFFKNTWDEFTLAQKSYMLLDMLLRVPEEVDGKLLKDDLKGLAILIKKFGVDPINDPSLPDISSSKQYFG
jgi:hypothetical protein